ncbi:type II toxin-antitoxin system prevent-host-death family antitoxin [Trichocoleus sp. Lan]|uniref:type II toxin-antitoxin system Phd/YefM family antitoxin n=1 Tax=Trichocoleus sp. Lan TaxID=2933927 RepID=UPI003298DAA6
MQQIDLAAASQPLPKLIEVALRGEEITISKDNHPVVKLVPVSPLKRPPQFGSVQILHRRTSACSITNEVASESSQRTASGISSGYSLSRRSPELSFHGRWSQTGARSDDRSRPRKTNRGTR